MDGDTPNGITSSWYRNTYPDRKKPANFGPKSLTDIFRGANDFWNFSELLIYNLWTLFWWFNI